MHAINPIKQYQQINNNHISYLRCSIPQFTTKECNTKENKLFKTGFINYLFKYINGNLTINSTCGIEY